MDVSAVYKGKGEGKGKKGKEKDKNKDKDKDPAANPDAEMICHYCHRKGHRKRDCRTFEEAPGLTFGAAAAPSVTPSRVSMIELDGWIRAVSLDDHEEMVRSIQRLMVDSGAAVSACPLGYAPEIPLSNHSRRPTLRTSPGAPMEHAGWKTVEYENGDGGSVNVNFEVADETTPSVAVGDLHVE